MIVIVYIQFHFLSSAGRFEMDETIWRSLTLKLASVYILQFSLDILAGMFLLMCEIGSARFITFSPLYFFFSIFP